MKSRERAPGGKLRVPTDADFEADGGHGQTAPLPTASM
jgi:hypothetical protein